MVRLSIWQCQEWKRQRRKWAMLTAYDYATAKILEEASIPVILVGDSLGRVLLGYENTIRVTLDDMIRHGGAVVRGTERAIVVIDMPFMTYQISADHALQNAGRLIQEAGAQSVKVEGGASIAEKVFRLTSSGIPVMGHLGFTPQSIYQNRPKNGSDYTIETAQDLISDARALEDAGAWSIVLDLVPSSMAKIITERASIPIIGIGSGPHCDAQVLVISDALGQFPGSPPPHAKRYAELGATMRQAIQEYVRDVESMQFPMVEHSFDVDFDHSMLKL